MERVTMYHPGLDNREKDDVLPSQVKTLERSGWKLKDGSTKPQPKSSGPKPPPLNVEKES